MIIIANGALVTPEGLRRGDIALDGGRIVEVAARIEPGPSDTVEDATGCWVLPGLIDAHTHLQCWTGMDWTADSFETGTRAAACGGTTTIVDYATADRGVTMDEALAEWHRRADGACTANYGFHMAIAEWGDDSPGQMRRMREAGVSSFKTYLAYDHLRLTDAETLRCLEAVRELDAVLCVHCENGDVVDELQRAVLARGITGPEGHPLSRPAEAEADAVSRLLYLASIAGARVNVVHLSTELGLEAVRAARARGQRGVFVETCPQYLTLDDTRYLEEGDDGFAGAKYVMSPPLRKPSDVRALRAAVLAGEVDSIATDHCSFNLHGQKDRGRGDFTRIPNGGPGIEHRPAVMATAFEGRLGPVELARLMSEGPARVFGMWPRKGRLAPGADADVCVWDPRARWTISAATQQQAVDYTPYEGMEAHGRAHLVYVGGVLAARDGAPTGARPGTYVSR
ncbi:dihydropyrimidinase [Candidatus Collinsella stercoripullorum]|uniref:dihydropyrimidinase n=1 Tax=Candidatus Collinsella stercoripullorum TaxID=2838522 RepID=UPI0022E476F8|nr:dihydropyrimidinase [Candidatus Collinsella stercoripullorum]